MAHTFKRKLRTLQKIMNDQCEFLKTCKRIDCFVEKKHVIILKNSVINYNHNTTVRFKTKHIDSVIVRERSKLVIYNKSKNIDEAIKEIELNDNK